MTATLSVDPSISRAPVPLDCNDLTTVCVFCGHNCGVRVDVRGGHIAAVRFSPTLVPEEVLADHARDGLALTRAAWRERITMLESQGATEVAYQPAGPDVPRELEAFARAVRG